jgi:hypothetical protein
VRFERECAGDVDTLASCAFRKTAGAFRPHFIIISKSVELLFVNRVSVLSAAVVVLCDMSRSRQQYTQQDTKYASFESVEKFTYCSRLTNIALILTA